MNSINEPPALYMRRVIERWGYSAPWRQETSFRPFTKTIKCRQIVKGTQPICNAHQLEAEKVDSSFYENQTRQ